MYLGDADWAGDEGNDPLGDVVCMECGQGDDEDNLMLCDGALATNVVLTLQKDDFTPLPSNLFVSLLTGKHKAFQPMQALLLPPAMSFHLPDMA